MANIFLTTTFITLKSTNNKKRMMLVMLTLLICSSQAKQSKHLDIAYNHSSKTISFYNSEGQPLSFHLSFQTKDIVMHESLKNQSIYLDKHRKHIIDYKMVKYQYKHKPGFKQHQDAALGVVGIGQGALLYEVFKKGFNSSAAKFMVQSKENIIKAVGEHCKYPVFTPFIVTLSETNTHSYQIDKLSTAFNPDSSFLSVIDRKKNPFSLDKHQLETDITVSLRDQIISLPLSSFVHCGKFSASNKLECDVQIKPQADVGGLLLDFDPTLCGLGVELDPSNSSDWQFHYTHLLLLIFQFVLLGCLMRENKVSRMFHETIDGKES